MVCGCTGNTRKKSKKERILNCPGGENLVSNRIYNMLITLKLIRINISKHLLIKKKVLQYICRLLKKIKTHKIVT